MVDVTGVREGTEGQDTAGGEAVGDEPGPGHVGLDLFQFSHGITGFHDG